MGEIPIPTVIVRMIEANLSKRLCPQFILGASFFGKRQSPVNINGAFNFIWCAMKNKKHLLSLSLCGIMAGISVVLQLPVFEISLPFVIPSFIKLDLSDLPALLTAFSAGPVWGGVVCVVKNVVHLAFGSTGGIGEIANALMGLMFVIPAGIIYKLRHSKYGALAGGAVGALAGAIVSFPVNMFITYPFYIAVFFGGEVEPLLDTYNAIFNTSFGLIEVLLYFNLPFTFVKYMLSVLIALLIYKPLSPLFKKFK